MSIYEDEDTNLVRAKGALKLLKVFGGRIIIKQETTSFTNKVNHIVRICIGQTALVTFYMNR